jgi:DNA-binding MarR family transcriptional regulator
MNKPIKAERKKPRKGAHPGRKDDSGPVESIERSILQIVRNIGKRKLGRNAERRLGGMVDFSHVAVVDSLAGCRESGTTATVGLLARRMGVDPSRASRMTAKAIRAGYARRIASQEDGRRICVELSRRGEDFAAAIREMRGRYFAAHLKSLSASEVETLAKLLEKFLHSDADRDNQTDNESRTGAVILLHPGAEAAAPARAKRRSPARSGKFKAKDRG